MIIYLIELFMFKYLKPFNYVLRIITHEGKQIISYSFKNKTSYKRNDLQIICITIKLYADKSALARLKMLS